MKYNFSELGASHHNPFLGLMVEINNASNGVFIMAFLFLIFFVSFFTHLRVTNDLGKSGVFSLHIVMILSILLYYMGKVAGYTLVPDLLMLGIIMLEIISVSVLYFLRNRGS